MNENEKYNANKQLLEDFNYDSQLQNAVMDELDAQ
jgi:hypothetical protein